MNTEPSLVPDIINILLVEDSIAQGQYFKECLEEVKKGSLTVTWVRDCVSALDALDHRSFDAVLLDLNLPDSMGADTFYKVYPKTGSTPVIILTIIDDDKTVMQLLQEGARDYFIKKGVNPRALYRTIHYSIIRSNAEEVVKAKKQEMENALRKAYDELDLKVKERTRELEKVNQALSQEINERKAIEEKLIESRTRYQIVADFNYHWETWVGPRGDYVYVSPSCERISGYPPEAFMENPDLIVDIAHPDDRETVYRHFKEQEDLISPMHPIDFRIIHKNGQTVWINHACRSVYDEKQNYLGRRGSNRDITDQINNQQKLEMYAKTQTTLLKEINHRVKNNLAVISSLLGLQIAEVSDERARMVLQDSRSRVQAMSMIHKTLCRSDMLSPFNLKRYLEDLGKQIVEGYQLGNKIDLKVDSEDIMISSKMASALGLVVNELIVNAIKYAFPGERSGEIHLAMKSMDDLVELTISDNGIGISEEIDLENRDSLGLKLVKTITQEQLSGSLEMDGSNGTTYRICFRVEDAGI